MKTTSNQKSITEILADFTAYVFKHPAASATYRELMTAISAQASPRVIIFILRKNPAVRASLP